MFERLIQNFNSPSEFAYSVHVSPDLDFIYFSNPKVACSTIKASLNKALARRHGKVIEYKSSDDIHDRERNLTLNPYQVGRQQFSAALADPKVFRFAFVRDPLGRAVSCYASKMTWDSYQRRKLYDKIGRAHDANISCEEFCALLSDPTIRDLDEHWRLQRKQVCSDDIDYTFVGRYDSLASDLTFVLGKLFGGDAQIFDVRNASNSAQVRAVLDGASKAAVRTAYADDYRMLADLFPAADSSVVRRVS